MGGDFCVSRDVPQRHQHQAGDAHDIQTKEPGKVITADKTVDLRSVPLAVIVAGITSLSCYVQPIPSRPRAVSCFLVRLMVQ
jgi:hypothetical protein